MDLTFPGTFHICLPHHSCRAIPESFCSVAGLVSLLAVGECCRQEVVYVVTLHWNKLLNGRGEEERLQFPDLYQIYQQGIGELLIMYINSSHMAIVPCGRFGFDPDLFVGDLPKTIYEWKLRAASTTRLVNIAVFAKSSTAFIILTLCSYTSLYVRSCVDICSAALVSVWSSETLRS